VLWSAPRPGAAPEGRHAHGRTMQLSQGQDRPPLMPEGALPTAGVLRSPAALPWWWVGSSVHGAAAGVNSLCHFCCNGIHSCINHLPSFLHSCKRVSGSSETKPYGKGVAPREYEEQPTLPRRSIFGKDSDESNTLANYAKLKEGCAVCIRPTLATWLRILAKKIGSGFSGSSFIVSSTYVEPRQSAFRSRTL
jgi:hypothetical protein